MMPASIQEIVYQSIGHTVCYEDVAQKIRAVISNKVTMSAGARPAPMDVGQVKYQCEYSDEDGGGQDVGAVISSTQCHGCGGWGHLKKDCPSLGVGQEAKGKGKWKGQAQNGAGPGAQPAKEGKKVAKGLKEEERRLQGYLFHARHKAA